MPEIEDKRTICISAFIIISINVLFFIYTLNKPDDVLIFVIYVIFLLLTLAGLHKCHADECLVLVLFGHYIGTIKKDGFFWTLPVSEVIRIENKIQIFNSPKTETTDHNNRSLVVSVLIFWQIKDFAKIAFKYKEKDDFIMNYTNAFLKNIVQYIGKQSTDRNILTREHAPNIAKTLKNEMQKIFDSVGININDLKITSLDYQKDHMELAEKISTLKNVLKQKKVIVDNAYIIASNLFSKITYPKDMEYRRIDDINRLVTDIMKTITI
ncbi:hypothetical protein GUI12_04590 [Anaplasmataceae bacterium AB001_6]|nr:hypothetical protein GUI12_04590 [Anaplasmataceae bacterium AB001_6]